MHGQCERVRRLSSDVWKRCSLVLIKRWTSAAVHSATISMSALVGSQAHSCAASLTCANIAASPDAIHATAATATRCERAALRSLFVHRQLRHPVHNVIFVSRFIIGAARAAVAWRAKLLRSSCCSSSRSTAPQNTSRSPLGQHEASCGVSRHVILLDATQSPCLPSAAAARCALRHAACLAHERRALPPAIAPPRWLRRASGLCPVSCVHLYRS